MTVQVALERVRAALPGAAVRLEPCIEVDERTDLEGVDAALSLHMRGDQPGFAQHPEVFGGPGLRQAGQLDQLAHGARAFAQELEHRAAVGIGERGPGGARHGR
jgi:hypothetical protein